MVKIKTWPSKTRQKHDQKNVKNSKQTLIGTDCELQLFIVEIGLKGIEGKKSPNIKMQYYICKNRKNNEYQCNT